MFFSRWSVRLLAQKKKKHGGEQWIRFNVVDLSRYMRALMKLC